MEFLLLAVEYCYSKLNETPANLLQLAGVFDFLQKRNNPARAVSAVNFNGEEKQQEKNQNY